jgi:hypothetical protein
MICRWVIALLAVIAVSAPAWAEFRNPFWISRPGHDAGDFGAAASKTGGAAFVWDEIGTPYQVKGRTLSPANVLGPILQMSRRNRSSFDPQAGINGRGDAHYTWNEWTAGIKTRRLSAEGLVEPTIDLSGTALSPKIAVTDEGRAVFVWESLKRAIETRTLFFDGTLGPKLTL